MGRLIRGTSKNARFIIVDSTDVIQECLNIHHCSPTAIDAFGRVLTAGIIMGSNLKGDDLLTIRTDSDGPIKTILVTSDAHGGVKGYVANPQAEVPLRENGKRNVPELMGRGTIKIIKDMGLREPYVGISELVSGGIAEDLAYYYYTSEQTPTVLALGVELEDEKTIKKAGGYMIQLLPGADESFISFLEEKIKAIRNITELLIGKMSLEDIAKLLYDDMSTEEDTLVEEYQILQEEKVQYFCNCNKNKFHRGLLTLGKDELSKIFKEETKLEVECHFCKKKHSFLEDDFNEFLEEK